MNTLKTQLNNALYLLNSKFIRNLYDNVYRSQGWSRTVYPTIYNLNDKCEIIFFYIEIQDGKYRFATSKTTEPYKFTEWKTLKSVKCIYCHCIRQYKNKLFKQNYVIEKNLLPNY